VFRRKACTLTIGNSITNLLKGHTYDDGVQVNWSTQPQSSPGYGSESLESLLNCHFNVWLPVPVIVKDD
jgi:hypothetical protein